MAILSASALRRQLGELISGKYLRRPNIVSTYPNRRALASVSSINNLIRGKSPKYSAMNLLASANGIPADLANARGPMPYKIPKLRALAAYLGARGNVLQVGIR